VSTTSRDAGPTGRFAAHQNSNRSDYRDDNKVADLEEVEEMELSEDPRRVSNNNNHTLKDNTRGSNSYKRGNTSSESEEEEEEETDHRHSTASTSNNKTNRVSQFDNSINRRRQWEDPDVTDDNISITSGVKPAPVRRVSGNVNTSFGVTRQSSQVDCAFHCSLFMINVVFLMLKTSTAIRYDRLLFYFNGLYFLV